MQATMTILTFTLVTCLVFEKRTQGDLSIMSMEGYGTDAFVYLTRLGMAREPLPI